MRRMARIKPPPRAGLSHANFRTSVYRMRRQYRELLEQEISFTVESRGEVRDELDHLVKILKSA